MDFADPDLFPRFEWHPAGKSARFTRHRLYRWAAVQQSVSVLYGLVSAIACSTPRGGRDERRGAGGGGTGKNGTRSPPSRSKAALASFPPAATRRHGGVERQAVEHQGVAHQQGRRPQARNQEGSSGGHGDSDSGKDVRKDRPRSSGAGAQIGKLRQGGACPGSLHRRGAAHGEPQARGCQARESCQIRDRQVRGRRPGASQGRNCPRRLPRPRSQRCRLRLARLPLRRSGQYRSKL